MTEDQNNVAGTVSVWTKTGRQYRIDGTREDFAELVGEWDDINNIIVQIAQDTVVGRTSIEAIEWSPLSSNSLDNENGD